MFDYHSRRARRKSAIGLPASGLPLFDYADSRITADPLAVTLPRAAQIIARRHALSPHIARLFAEHAGFNLEASE